jgi:DNA repair exonuclease SbcCD ATPase subunit
MKQIRILDIVAEGFRSLSERTTVNLDRPGLNLVKGTNGVGKTTVFEALVWCLFGTNLKGTTADKIPTWPETRTEAFQGTYVNVTLDVDGERYSIVRTIGWSGGQGIGRDDLAILGHKNEGVHKKDVQVQIDQLLGMDSRTFMNSILFGQRMSKLVETSNKDKRDLFETLFEATFIEEAKKKALKEITELKVEESEADSNVIILGDRCESLRRAAENQQQILDNFDKQKQEDVEAAYEKVADLQADITKKEEDIAYYQEIVDEWNQAAWDKEMDEIDNTINAYNEMKKNEEGPKQKWDEATQAVGKAARAETVAATNVNLQKKRDEQWVLDKAADVTLLKDELQELMNTQTEKLNAVADLCYACGQALDPADVEAVKTSIKANFAPQLESVNIRLGDRRGETPPPSNLPELERIHKEAKEDLTQAREKEAKLKKAYDAAVEKNKALTQSYNNALSRDDRLNEELREYESKAGLLTDAKNDLAVLRGQIGAFQSAYETEMDRKPPVFEKSVPELHEEYTAACTDYDIAMEKLKAVQHEIALHSWWSSKGFAATGLPSFVFKAMLDGLNNNVQEYADRLGVSIEFSINLGRASKPFTTICSVGDRIDKEYKEFSGGQKQRLDIVLIFAMHKLVSAGSNINVMIMDEVFEGLDEAGEAAVFDLVREMTEHGKAVYIITHSPHIDSMYASTITVTADENGATKIDA